MQTYHLLTPPERIIETVTLDVSPDLHDYKTPDIEYIETINQMCFDLNQTFNESDLSSSIEILQHMYELFDSFGEEDLSQETEDIIINSNIIFRAKQFFHAENMDFSYWIIKCITKFCYLSSFVVEKVIQFRLYQYYINPFYDENFSPFCFGEMLSFLGCIAADSPEGIVTILEAYNIPNLIKIGLSMNNIFVVEKCLFCSEQILTNSKFPSSYRMLNEATLLFLDFGRQIFCSEPQFSQEETDSIKIKMLSFLSFITRNKQSIDFFCEQILKIEDSSIKESEEVNEEEQIDAIDQLLAFVFYEIPEDSLYRLRQTEIIYNILTGCNEEKQLDIMHKIDYQAFMSFLDLRFMRSCCDFMMLVIQMIKIDENIIGLFDELSLIERVISLFNEEDQSIPSSCKRELMLFAVILIYIIKNNSILEKFLDIDFINEFVMYNSTFEETHENLLFIRSAQILYSLPTISEELQELIAENVPEIHDDIEFSDDILQFIHFVVYM